jgi:hypothetical protein
MTVEQTKRSDILDHIAGKTDIGALPTGMALALFTTAPNASGDSGTEVTAGNGYARLLFPGTEWTAATAANPSVLANANETDIGPAAGAAMGTIVGVGLMVADTEAADDVIAYFDLASDVVINDGDTFRIAAAAMTLSLA